MINPLPTIPLALSAAFLFVSLGQAVPAHAAVPVASLASGLVAQGGYGTIKGRLVWGGDTAPPQKFSVDKGMANKDPGVLRGEPRRFRMTTSSSTPRQKG